MNGPILIDMDETMVDMVQYWLDAYNDRTGNLDFLSYEDIVKYDITNFTNNPDIFLDILHEEGFFVDMEPMPGAVKFFQKLLNDGYDVVIVTQVPRKSKFAIQEKRGWIKRYFPEYDLSGMVFAHRKELVSGSILFDDNPNHLVKWKKKNPNGLTATIDCPYNRGVECDARFTDRQAAWRLFYEFVRRNHELHKSR